jgi:hypothetical protein
VVLIGHYSREINGAITPATISINRERRERKGEMMKLTGGSHLSFVEEKERVPFRDFGRVGRFQSWAEWDP